MDPIYAEIKPFFGCPLNLSLKLSFQTVRRWPWKIIFEFQIRKRAQPLTIIQMYNRCILYSSTGKALEKLSLA